MEEHAGRMLACQIMITALVARFANESADPLSFLTEFRDEVKAVIAGIRISGADEADRIRAHALRSADELFSLMKEPAADD